uniref:RUN domain-containing protein n=1 Tax=Echinostoma caproni TaxID=27848 RepID=A0A183ANR4_9TREM
LEKQRLVLEELTARLELDISNLERLSDEELRQVVESAVHQFLNPVKINEKLVEQLKTQVVDLERFIDFLHGSGTCGEALTQALAEFKRTHQLTKAVNEPSSASSSTIPDDAPVPGIQLGHSRHLNRDRTETAERARPLGAEVELLAANFTQSVRNSATVERAKLQHWGTVRARLELAVNAVLEKVELYQSYQLKQRQLETHKQTSCIRRPVRTSVSSACTQLQSETNETTVSVEANRLARQLRRFQTYSVRSSCSSMKVGTDQDLPGTKIALPVQNLHDASLRAMLNGAQADLPPSAYSVSESRTSSGAVCKIPTNWKDSIADTEEFLKSEAQRMIIRVVRRQLCPALRDLIEHGLMRNALITIHEENGSVIRPGNFLLKPILGCFNSRRRRLGDALEDGLDPIPHPGDCEDPPTPSKPRSRRTGTHAWHILLKFYNMKVSYCHISKILLLIVFQIGLLV